MRNVALYRRLFHINKLRGMELKPSELCNLEFSNDIGTWSRTTISAVDHDRILVRTAVIDVMSKDPFPNIDINNYTCNTSSVDCVSKTFFFHFEKIKTLF